MDFIINRFWENENCGYVFEFSYITKIYSTRDDCLFLDQCDTPLHYFSF